VTGGTDSTIRVWDLRLLSEEESRPSTPPLSRIDEDGEDFAHESGERNLNGHTTSIRQSVELESPNTCARVLEGHTRAITTLYFEEDSLVTGASDKTIRQWDLTTGQCVLTMDILWAISHPAPTPYRQNSTSLYSDGIGSGIGFPGQGLLSAASGVFAVPTPPYADGTWDMYEDYVGGVQFWGHALVSGSGDGGVRMWDSKLFSRRLADTTSPYSL
jgi:division protein 1